MKDELIHHKDTKNTKYQKQLFQTLLSVLQREVFKHFEEDSRPREDKIILNKVAKAAKTNHGRSLVETVLSSWPLCPCCEISGGCGSCLRVFSVVKFAALSSGVFGVSHILVKKLTPFLQARVNSLGLRSGREFPDQRYMGGY